MSMTLSPVSDQCLWCGWTREECLWLVWPGGEQCIWCGWSDGGGQCL